MVGIFSQIHEDLEKFFLVWNFHFQFIDQRREIFNLRSVFHVFVYFISKRLFDSGKLIVFVLIH